MTGAEIHFDLSPVEQGLAEIARSLETGILERIPKGLLDRLLRLLERGGLDGCISASGTTSVAGDHVIRLGIAGDLQAFASALAALERDLTHGDDPRDGM